MSDRKELEQRLSGPDFELETGIVQQIGHFYSLLVDENTRQNLTRLSSVNDFIEGHVVDCLELAKSGLAEYPAMDLGSGPGVPGLLSAILGYGSWVLLESEGRKAEFLNHVVNTLGIERVQVVSGRGEHYLKQNEVHSVVARAVGKVEKIYNWIGHCSTWNNLVLLKSRGWEDEWAEFKQSQHRRQLEITEKYEYHVGIEQKYRVIVRLERP